MTKIEEIDLTLLQRFDGNPRFEVQLTKEFLADIDENGVLVPLLVTPNDSMYDVIDGERRRQASLKLKLTRVPCIVQEMDEETKWNRAFHDNATRQDFSPMEEAQNLYERKKRFYKTDDELARAGGREHTHKWASERVALNKLPEIVQSLVHRKLIGIKAAYELSRLAFDVNFPATGSKPPRDWHNASPRKNLWDFLWDNEPPKWKEEREKIQTKLANDFMNDKINVEGINTRVNLEIDMEKDRRKREDESLAITEKRRKELEGEISAAIADLTGVLTNYNARLATLEEEYKLDTFSQQFALSEEKMSIDFVDLTHQIQQKINEALPNKTQLSAVRNALDGALDFERKFKAKQATIWAVAEKPICPYCGNEAHEELIEQHKGKLNEKLQELTMRQENVKGNRKDLVALLIDIEKLSKGIKDLQQELKEMEQELAGGEPTNE